MAALMLACASCGWEVPGLGRDCPQCHQRLIRHQVKIFAEAHTLTEMNAWLMRQAILEYDEEAPALAEPYAIAFPESVSDAKTKGLFGTNVVIVIDGVPVFGLDAERVSALLGRASTAEYQLANRITFEERLKLNRKA